MVFLFRQVIDFFDESEDLFGEVSTKHCKNPFLKFFLYIFLFFI